MEIYRMHSYIGVWYIIILIEAYSNMYIDVIIII